MAVVALLFVLPTLLFIVGITIPVRFNDPFFNYLYVSIAVFVLPFFAIYGSLLINKDIFKVIAVCLSGLLILPAIIVVFLNLLTLSNIAKTGLDSSFERIKYVDHGAYQYVLYRTNGGATTSFGLVLRKEKALFFGLKTVEHLFGTYRAKEASLVVIDDNTLQLAIAPYGKDDKFDIVRFNLPK